MAIDLILFAIALTALSGLPGAVLCDSSFWGERWAVCCLVVAGLLGGIGAGMALFGGASPSRVFFWPAAGDSLVGVDALSAFFLFPVLLVGAAGSMYGLGYWSRSDHPGTGRRLRFFWGILVSGMLLLVVSRHAMAFLFGWEMMALSAFFLIGTEGERGESRWAAWIYLVATHLSTLTLFALFVVWRGATGSFLFEPPPGGSLGFGLLNGLFILALVGFGLKAGVMPLHFWLPGAHAAAPSHVSAILSGVVLKMGIYGLLRWIWMLPELATVWGVVILLLGVASGLLGVVFAIAQHDLKRLLAYHSVENIGIILMGLGLAMLGRSFGRPELLVLGLSGCLLHVWNHALFKSLLFFGAGSVLRATHTREIALLGGLAVRMPWTAAMFLLGSVAICGLPPLNGFVSELLVFLGLFSTVSDGGASWPIAAIAAPVLAMIGALALACFVKVCGAVFLGTPRTKRATNAVESPLSMGASMAVLAGCCVVIGVAPWTVAPVIDRVVALWSPLPVASLPPLGSLAPLGSIGLMGVLLLVGSVLVTLLLVRRCGESPRVGTWDCGYARPTETMQYSASSFAQMITRLFSWVLRPAVHQSEVSGLFPLGTSRESHVGDPVLDRVVLPARDRIALTFRWFHRFQQGLTQHYVLYILITVVLMLSTLIPIGELLERLVTR